MKTKEAWYAVVGGCVGAVLTMVVCSFSPLGAQNDVRDAEFGTITCRSIKVKSPNSPEGVWITGGNFLMYRGEGIDDFQKIVKISGTEKGGGQVRVCDRDGYTACWIIGGPPLLPHLMTFADVVIGGSDLGGYINVQDKDGELGAMMNAFDVSVK